MENKRQSLALKFVVVGDPMVGKTSLILSFTRRFFPTEPADTTLVPEKYCKELAIGNTTILFSVIDTPSLDGCYESLRTAVYPKTTCFIICYAVNNPSSFANIENLWLPEIHEMCPDAFIVLLGTKQDLFAKGSSSAVSEDEALKLATKYHFDGVHRCSAKSVDSLEEIFVQVIKVITKIP